jgi:hypothetical protein
MWGGAPQECALFFDRLVVWSRLDDVSCPFLQSTGVRRASKSFVVLPLRNAVSGLAVAARVIIRFPNATSMFPYNKHQQYIVVQPRVCFRQVGYPYNTAFHKIFACTYPQIDWNLQNWAQKYRLSANLVSFVRCIPTLQYYLVVRIRNRICRVDAFRRVPKNDILCRFGATLRHIFWKKRQLELLVRTPTRMTAKHAQ